VLKPRAAAVYVRISDDKAADAAGVGRQETDCRALADRQGWAVAEIYTENDTSAFKRRKVRLPDGSTALRVVRPAFRRLLDDLAAGTVDALVGYDLDRVARDPRDLEDLIDIVESRGVPTRAVTGSLDLGSDAGITMARVMVAVANKGSRDTARRVLRKQLELAEQGKHKGGGIRAYGYERDGVTVNEHEAGELRGMVQALLAGASLHAVAAALNARGVPTVRGGPWTSRSVHVVVTKPRVVGLRTHRGEVVGPAEWPAIIDRDTWEHLLLVLDGRARGSTNTMVRWLSQVLHCGRCGHGLTGAQQGGDRGPRYWCATPRGGCGGIGIDALQSEGFVEQLLLGYLARPDVLATLRAATSSEATDAARHDVTADQAQLRELAGMWAARQITTPEYMRARGDIEQRLQRTQELLRASLPGAVRELVGSDLQATWEGFSPAQRREVAQAVFVKGIHVEPSRRGGLQGFDAERLVPVEWSNAP
jgi:site-specific DNA recombinase